MNIINWLPANDGHLKVQEIDCAETIKKAAAWSKGPIKHPS